MNLPNNTHYNPSGVFLDSYLFVDELRRKSQDPESFPLRGFVFLTDGYTDGRENPIVAASFTTRADMEWMSDVLANCMLESPDIMALLTMAVSKAVTELTMEQLEDPEEEDDEDEDENEEYDE